MNYRVVNATAPGDRWAVATTHFVALGCQLTIFRHPGLSEPSLPSSAFPTDKKLGQLEKPKRDAATIYPAGTQNAGRAPLLPFTRFSVQVHSDGPAPPGTFQGWLCCPKPSPFPPLSSTPRSAMTEGPPLSPITSICAAKIPPGLPPPDAPPPPP